MLLRAGQSPQEPRLVTAPGGRGMHLVTTLADDWGVELDEGKTVWVEYALQPGGPVPGPR